MFVTVNVLLIFLLLHRTLSLANIFFFYFLGNLFALYCDVGLVIFALGNVCLHNCISCFADLP